jgi:hypothetical protein
VITEKRDEQSPLALWGDEGIAGRVPDTVEPPFAPVARLGDRVSGLSAARRGLRGGAYR